MDTENIQKDIATAGEDLFQFAIHRGDMNAILERLPFDMAERRVALEYEIQLLRIIAVGWAIAFFLSDSALKAPLGNYFWEQIRSFATTLSTSASLSVGTDIDYFSILKERLSYYVKALDAAGDVQQPATAIGPAFAGMCGDREDACAILAGSKMFVHTIEAVREYLGPAVSAED
ncbi:putative cytoplasmic protein [Desulfosarcina cetonica]|uniref:hypothetical protein n=1 Tax=Desulfosarcina cetonica TaxID=90730 RepID=UPI0006D0B4D0|nr:hypothetical protein [Desulfosarcina cetonica]VTR70185.1 putative cytoplasmic protein [Desulfosarcina cetonica]